MSEVCTYIAYKVEGCLYGINSVKDLFIFLYM